MAKLVKIHVPWFPMREKWKASENETAYVPRFLPVVRMRDGSLGVVYQYRKVYEPEVSNLRVLEEHAVCHDGGHKPLWQSGRKVVELLGILDLD